MMDSGKFEKLLLAYDDVKVDDSLGEGLRAFHYVGGDDADKTMFAIVYTGSKPLKVSLRCDPQLSQNLREEYETVLPGENLDRKVWNTIICSGQLTEDEVLDLARLAYNIVAGLV